MDTTSSSPSSSTQAQLVQLKISSTLPSYRTLSGISTPSLLSSSLSSSPSVHSRGTDAPFSAGSIQPSRIRLLSSSSFLRASHNQLSLIHVPKLPTVYSTWDEHVYDQQHHRLSSTKRSKRVQTSTASTSSVTSPYLLDETEEDTGSAVVATHYSYPLPSLQTPHEIMSIDMMISSSSSPSFPSTSAPEASTWTIGTIDSYGSGCVSTYTDSNVRTALRNHTSLPDPLSSYTFRIPSIVENSWTGLSISPSHASSVVACTHALQKQVYILDNQGNSSSVINQYSTLLCPTSLQYFPLSHTNAHCLAITEGNALRIIDPRISSSPSSAKHTGSSTVFRDTPGGLTEKELLYSLSIGDHYYLAVAGTNSMIYLYDCRTNRLRTRWNCPTKHHIIGTQLHESKGLCYIAGADQEILGWKWNTTTTTSSSSSSTNKDTVSDTFISGTNKSTSGGGGEGRKLNLGGFTGKVADDTTIHASVSVETNRGNVLTTNTTITGTNNSSNSTWIQREKYIQHKTDHNTTINEDTDVGTISSSSLSVNGTVPNTVQSSSSSSASSSTHTPPPPKLARAGYRGSSRWIGFSVLNNGGVPNTKETKEDEGDLLLSVCDDGYVYFLNHAERMA